MALVPAARQAQAASNDPRVEPGTTKHGLLFVVSALYPLSCSNYSSTPDTAPWHLLTLSSSVPVPAPVQFPSSFPSSPGGGSGVETTSIVKGEQQLNKKFPSEKLGSPVHPHSHLVVIGVLLNTRLLFLSLVYLSFSSPVAAGAQSPITVSGTTSPLRCTGRPWSSRPQSPQFLQCADECTQRTPQPILRVPHCTAPYIHSRFSSRRTSDLPDLTRGLNHPLSIYCIATASSTTSDPVRPCTITDVGKKKGATQQLSPQAAAPDCNSSFPDVGKLSKFWY